MTKLIIGSRGSKLALLQSRQVADLLIAKHPHLDVQISIIQTRGDKNLHGPLDKIGGKAAFTIELEESLFNHKIDLAVHSLKDLPSTLVDGFIYQGSPLREDARDVFVSTKWQTLDEVPNGGTIATGSSRRKSQLLHFRPDLIIEGLRGNVDTRLKKLEDSNWDGIITAAAAMHRLGLGDVISEYLEPDMFVPSGGQGALGLEIAENRDELKHMLNAIIDDDTTICCKAERIYLSKVEGGCSAPIGCWARIDKKTSYFTAYCANINGTKLMKNTVSGDIDKLDSLALKLANDMIQDGAYSLFSA